MPALSITSPHNPRVKQAARLREHRERVESGRTLIDGSREIERAIEAGVAIRELFISSSAAESELGRLLLGRVEALQGECFVVSAGVYEKLAYGERHDGIVAVAETPRRTLADLKLPQDRAPLVAVVEGLEKPGNLGAILRSADAIGLDALVVCGGTDLYNPNVIRASVGTIFSVPVVAAEPAEALAWLRAAKLQIAAAVVGAEKLYADLDLRRPTAFVLGSEAAGLSPLWHAPDILPIALPMQGLADSLNVSVTAAVLFYEAWRQRR